MAKGSAMGLWKGKKGSSVFYRIWNTNNKEAQGIREYRAEVKNPQSDRQADQRARLLPAQLVKGALRDIVSRSFQGIPYGSRSRLEFLKYALRVKEGYPFLPKGFNEPVPGKYMISKGTLTQITSQFDGDDLAFVTSLKWGLTEIAGTTTIGEVSQGILENNNDWQEGDQLTIVGCLCDPLSDPLTADFSWRYYSFYVNPADTTTLSDLPGENKITMQTGDSSDEAYLKLGGEADNIVAAAVIHSRLGDDGLYLRSTAVLALNPAIEDFFADDQSDTTRASYQDKQGYTSYDWPVEDETRGGGSSATDGTFTLSGLTGDLAQCNGRTVKVRVNSLTGSLTAVYVNNATDKVLVDPSGAQITYTATGGEVGYLNQSQVPALSSLPIVVYG